MVIDEMNLSVPSITVISLYDDKEYEGKFNNIE